MEELRKNIRLIKDYSKENYKKCFRQAKGLLSHNYLVPGAVYEELWDWDSWLSGIAINKISDGQNIFEYEKGCVLNFLSLQDENGRIPINATEKYRESLFNLSERKTNIHKPCLVQHALFICEKNNSYGWIESGLQGFERFIKWYDDNCFHEKSGLYYWIDDFAVGVDNDPCVFYRPHNSCASILLNCLMYDELKALSKLHEAFGNKEKFEHYSNKADELKNAINTECWDERDGFYYSVDINFLPVDKTEWLHSGAPLSYNSLIMRIGVWAGFMPLWSKIASKEQAQRIVQENYLDQKTFNSPNGVRSLSKLEKMYQIKATGNPSCWLGPIWLNVNYFVFKGLLNYGYTELAKELAMKIVNLLGSDLSNCGEYHEYYNPETGEGVNNQGFQSWNLLGYNIAVWLEENL